MNVNAGQRSPMTVKEALDHVKKFESAKSFGDYDGYSAVLASRSFLDCHEKYKPLVEALGRMKIKCGNCDYWTEHVSIATSALDHYRKEILGESKPLGE